MSPPREGVPGDPDWLDPYWLDYLDYWLRLLVILARLLAMLLAIG